MTKEEKALRGQIRVAVPNPVMRRSVLLKVGKALRAAREECAKVAEDEVPNRRDIEVMVDKADMCNYIAAAIRRGVKT